VGIKVGSDTLAKSMRIGRKRSANRLNVKRLDNAQKTYFQKWKRQMANDAAFIDLVSTLCVFLTGTLAGILSANGLKSKLKPQEGKENEPQESN
jgi:hypothetical protein